MPWNVLLLLQHLLLLLDVASGRWKCDFQATNFTMVVVLPWELNSSLTHMNQMFYHWTRAQGLSLHFYSMRIIWSYPSWHLTSSIAQTGLELLTLFPPSLRFLSSTYEMGGLAHPSQTAVLEVLAPRETRDDSGWTHIPISGILWSTGSHYIGMCSSVDV